MQRLLERDPLQRISFEEFFTHPFVDMEHMPSAESLCKAVSLTDAERSLGGTALRELPLDLPGTDPGHRCERRLQCSRPGVYQI